MAVTPLSAADALAIKAKYYVSGEPCLRGHRGLRVARSRECLACRKARKNAHRRALRAAKDAALIEELRQEILAELRTTTTTQEDTSPTCST